MIVHTCISLLAALIASGALLCCPTPAPAAAEDHPPPVPFSSGLLNGNQVAVPVALSGGAAAGFVQGLGR